MRDIDRHEMLAAAPLQELLEQAEAELEEVVELAPDSATRFERARALKKLRGAINDARTASPTCDSAEAAEIMNVSERQARNLAKQPDSGVISWQRVAGGPWTFDVRSCHAYAAMKRNGRAA